MSGRRAAMPLAGLAGLGIIGAVWWGAHTPGRGHPAALGLPGLPAAPTAVVTRTDVAARDEEPGTLGYAGDWRLASPGPGGVLTAIPVPGRVIRRGQVLYEIDDQPTRLLYGSRPAWRDFTFGMSDGPDVRQLQASLAALGYGAGLTVDNHFSAATADAISTWQAAIGVPQTGQLVLGQVVFAPGPVRVSQALATPGTRITQDQPVIEATSTTRVVTVSLPTIQQAAVTRGTTVQVTTPAGAQLQGTVSDVGRVAQAAQDGAPAAPGAGPAPAITVTITLDQPGAAARLDQAPVQVAITTDEHKGVLAVPVTALVAAASGGYQLIADDGGTRRRITVQPGIFDEITNKVEVSGPGLAAGQRVEVAS